ncbi:hypothetical protein B296_00050164 [Ensete ventricosum]|uniref:Uncharacterized protein n=1 Tax=Ensete ventricosum TaxID=4639 RepID=A0A426WX13_ENSVE|nr:hypothetical protein B296_00050164 [Ensete ventricosum]
MRNGGYDDAVKLSRLRWCRFQVAAMLLEGGRRGNLDHEATMTVEEEKGSNNVGLGCDAIVWATSGDGGCLQAAMVEVGAAKVRLRQRKEGATECMVIVEEGSYGVGRETAASNLHYEGSLLAARDLYWQLMQ